MKQIITGSNFIPFESVDRGRPVFAMRDGNLRGMVVHEDDGWILRTGGENGADGFHRTLLECITSCTEYGYTFHVED